MTIAGRILIMPQGAYNEKNTYEMLDLVSCNGTAWLAKKTVTGIEPSEESSEYWHKMFDISEYLTNNAFASIILKSSTEGSEKHFRITIDDSGTLTATEIV